MRILFLCNSHIWGGAEKYVVDVARGLAGRGHVCRIAAPPETPLVRAAAGAGIETLPIDIGPKLSRRTVPELVLRWRAHADTLRRFMGDVAATSGTDLLHVQFKKEQLLGTPAAAALGIPVVWTEHGQLPPALAHIPPALMLYRCAALIPARVLCVSGFVAEDLARHGLDRSKLHVCYNGIDVGAGAETRLVPHPISPFIAAWFSGPAAPLVSCVATAPGHARSERAAVRAAWGIGVDDLVIGTSSRLVRNKGHQDLLAAGPQLIRRFPHLRFLIVGEGPARPALERQAARLGIERHVHFTGHTPDVRPMLAAMDVFASPSRSEGLPFSVLEAMAAGRPVVGTRIGGIPEALCDGKAGVLVEAGDVAELGRALAALLEDGARRTRLASAGRTRVLSLFTMQRMIDETETVFQAAAYTGPAAERRALRRRPDGADLRVAS